MNLSPEAAARRFAEQRSAILATADADGRPHLVPVTFATEDGVVFIAIDHKPKRSMNLKRLRNIEVNPKVSLLAQSYDDDWERLWWVRGDGVATVVSDDADRALPIDLLQQRYPQYVETVPAGPVIVVRVDRWTGWTYADDTEQHD